MYCLLHLSNVKKCTPLRNRVVEQSMLQHSKSDPDGKVQYADFFNQFFKEMFRMGKSKPVNQTSPVEFIDGIHD